MASPPLATAGERVKEHSASMHSGNQYTPSNDTPETDPWSVHDGKSFAEHCLRASPRAPQERRLLELAADSRPRRHSETPSGSAAGRSEITCSDDDEGLNRQLKLMMVRPESEQMGAAHALRSFWLLGGVIARVFGKNERRGSALPSPSSSTPLLTDLPKAVCDSIYDSGRQPSTSLLAWFELGGDVNAKDEKSRTLAHHAAAGNNMAVIKLLVRRGADLTVKTAEEASPLYIASLAGYDKTVARLLKAQADPNLRCGYGLTPLMIACRAGRSVKVIRALLAAGARLEDADDLGNMVADHASIGGKMSVAIELRRHFTRAPAEKGGRSAPASGGARPATGRGASGRG